MRSPTPAQNTAQIKWTVDDYHRMIAAGILENRRVELLAGEIVLMPPEGPSHTYYGGSLADLFRRKLSDRTLVRSAVPITLPNEDEPEPDIAVVQGAWDRYKDRHPYPEDIFLVVEVSDSTLKKDTTQKRKTYAAANIPEYWVLNLKANELIVYRTPEAGNYTSERRFSHGSISPISFSDLSFSVEQLFK